MPSSKNLSFIVGQLQHHQKQWFDKLYCIALCCVVCCSICSTNRQVLLSQRVHSAVMSTLTAATLWQTTCTMKKFQISDMKCSSLSFVTSLLQCSVVLPLAINGCIVSSPLWWLLAEVSALTLYYGTLQIWLCQQETSTVH